MRGDYGYSIGYSVTKENVANGIDLNYSRFAMVMMDDTGNSVGLLSAYIVFAEIYVDEIWIDTKYR